MNIFRLVLCLAGLLTFLLLRHLAPLAKPEAAESSLSAATLEPATLSSLEPNREASPVPFPSTMLLPPLEPPERFDLGRKIVLMQKGPGGARYSVLNTQGVVLGHNLTETEFQSSDPQLYAMLQMAQAPAGDPQQRFLGLYLRPDGRLR